MKTKSRLSVLLVLAAAALALACSAALIPHLAFGDASETYNLTVGKTLVGQDSSKWQGQGEARSYVYDEADLSYVYYPATSTLQLNGGTITGYYVYNDGSKDVEVSGVVSANCVPSAPTMVNIQTLTVEVSKDTTVLVSQHASTNADPSAKAFTESSLQSTISATVCGPSTLTVSTDGVLDSCSASGFMFNEVALSGDNPAHIVFDSVCCACSDKNGFSGFTGIQGDQQIIIGQNSTIEFNNIEVASDGIASFAGITGKTATVENDARVTLHNLDFSCGQTAQIGYTHVALFHLFGNFTSTGDMYVAPNADDAISISLANNIEYGHEKIIVAGIAVDHQAGDAEVCVSGTFVMNNVTLTANATENTYEEGEVFCSGIHNGSSHGAMSLTDLDFTFNEYGTSTISIGGKSVVRLTARTIEESIDLEAKNSLFDITLPKVDATYLCDRSDVAGMMVLSGGMALSNSIINVDYSDITVQEKCNFLGHAGLVAAGNITIDGVSRYTVACTETGDMSGIEASVVALADDALLNIKAPAGKPAIVSGLYSSHYAYAGKEAEQSGSLQASLADSSNAEIVSLAEGYAPYIAYGADAQSAATATTLASEQYSENSYFAIRNTTYDYHVSFDSMGGSAVETQTVHNLGLALKPADPLKDGYTFVGWCTDVEGTELYDFDTPVVGDITLYAKWTENAVAPATSSSSTPKTGDTCAPVALLALTLATCASAGIAFTRRKTKLR